MRIVVCLKQVPDPVTVAPDPLTGAIDPQDLLYIINPPDLEAVELALRLRDASNGAGSEVIVLSLGPARVEKALRHCLAMGVDRVTRLAMETVEPPGSSVVAIALAGAIRSLGEIDLVLCGARSQDRGSGEVPARLSELLGLPCASSVTGLEVGAGHVTVHRKLERGAREVVRLPLPAVLGLETGLAEPRYPTLPTFMEALQASIPVLQLPRAGAPTLPLHTPDALEVRCPQATVGPPRPRPRAIFTPDYRLPPEERIVQILTAGTPRKAGVLLEGSPAELAVRLVAFLRERGFLTQEKQRDGGERDLAG